MEELKNIDPKSLKSDIFQDLTINCLCYSVYDGDTISVIFKFGELYCRKNIRLLGIDSCEIKSKIKSEKDLAIRARDYLREKILGKLIQINMLKLDKYGRQLGIIYCDNININEDLIKGGFVRPYDGKKKEIWNLDNDLNILDN
mgnify:CR=1 FL=1